MTLSIILFTLSLICYNISQKQLFGQLPWRTKIFGFWGIRSYERKYLIDPDEINYTEYYPKRNAPSNWYYKIFGIKYQEAFPGSAFPGSATILVPFTDGYHLFQFIGFKLMYLSFLNFVYNMPLQKEVVNYIVPGPGITISGHDALTLPSFWTSFFIMWGIEVAIFNMGFKLIKK